MKKTLIILSIALAVAFSFVIGWKENDRYGRKNAVKECVDVAAEDARDLLKTKNEVYRVGAYSSDAIAAEKGLFIKEDFERQYRMCMLRKGYDLP